MHSWTSCRKIRTDNNCSEANLGKDCVNDPFDFNYLFALAEIQKNVTHCVGDAMKNLENYNTQEAMCDSLADVPSICVNNKPMDCLSPR